MPAAPRLFMHGGGNTEHFGSLYIKIYTHPRKCNPSPLNICGGRKPSPRGNSPARGGITSRERFAKSLAFSPSCRRGRCPHRPTNYVPTRGGRKAPLCKGGCHDRGRDWGIVAVHRAAFERASSLQSLHLFAAQKSTSLCTREALVRHWFQRNLQVSNTSSVAAMPRHLPLEGKACMVSFCMGSF